DTPPFTLHELHYVSAVAAHIAGGIELSEAVAATRAAADRARAMVDASPLPMALVDTAGTVRQLNGAAMQVFGVESKDAAVGRHLEKLGLDRKSTRLNSSHVATSYAVFCLKKKSTTDMQDKCYSRGFAQV